MSPHTGEALCCLLLKVFKEWGIQGKATAVTKENEIYVIEGVTFLHKNMFLINKQREKYIPIGDFHVRCTAEVINLSVKDCLKFIRDEFYNVRAMVTSVRCSVKRRQQLSEVRIEHGLPASLTIPLDLDTRW